MAIQGELKTLEEAQFFCREMVEKGHRPETAHFVMSIWGREMGRGEFTLKCQAAIKTGYSPSRCRGLYEYLSACGMIRINEQ